LWKEKETSNEYLEPHLASASSACEGCDVKRQTIYLHTSPTSPGRHNYEKLRMYVPSSAIKLGVYTEYRAMAHAMRIGCDFKQQRVLDVPSLYSMISKYDGWSGVAELSYRSLPYLLVAHNY
jgi:hypothetical protein